MNTITATADGSNTLFNDQIGENYHSKHGAVQESKHVFIDVGLRFAGLDKESIRVLEVGFGTGLNFLLSMATSEEMGLSLDYTGLETHPLPIDVIRNLGYGEYVHPTQWKTFYTNYQAALNARVNISGSCRLQIITQPVQDFIAEEKFDLIYFDAFSVRHQPELWTNEVIAHTCAMLKPGGIFVTYAITGDLKRSIKACGFDIQKLPGAPGKREMLRAIKIKNTLDE